MNTTNKIAAATLLAFTAAAMSDVAEAGTITIEGLFDDGIDAALIGNTHIADDQAFSATFTIDETTRAFTMDSFVTGGFSAIDNDGSSVAVAFDLPATDGLIMDSGIDSASHTPFFGDYVFENIRFNFIDLIGDALDGVDLRDLQASDFDPANYSTHKVTAGFRDVATDQRDVIKGTMTNVTYTPDIVPVPAPPAALLFAVGLGLLGAAASRRRFSLS